MEPNIHGVCFVLAICSLAWCLLWTVVDLPSGSCVRENSFPLPVVISLLNFLVKLGACILFSLLVLDPIWLGPVRVLCVLPMVSGPTCSSYPCPVHCLRPVFIHNDFHICFPPGEACSPLIKAILAFLCTQPNFAVPAQLSVSKGTCTYGK